MPVLTANSIQSSNPGLNFTAAGQTWTIAPNVVCSSENNFGVIMGFADGRLNNHGLIVSDDDSGVLADAVNQYIFNGADGSIFGEVGITVSASGGDSVIDNLGSITGVGATAILLNAGASITNSGTIYSDRGSSDAIQAIFAGDARVDVVNYGEINSGDNAISGQTTGRFVIDNSGTIKGGIILGALTDSFIYNTGLIEGVILCGNQDDRVVNLGTLTEAVNLGGGDDIYDGRNGILASLVNAGDGDDVAVGGGGDDAFRGEAGGDILRGRGGDDILIGGGGGDTLRGGEGADIFLYTAASESRGGGAGRDTIEDFKPGQDDLIDLSQIDAKTGSRNDTFTLIGGQGFHGVKGELRFQNSGADTIIQGDTDGDGVADLDILVLDVRLDAGDLVL